MAIKQYGNITEGVDQHTRLPPCLMKKRVPRRGGLGRGEEEASLGLVTPSGCEARGSHGLAIKSSGGPRDGIRSVFSFLFDLFIFLLLFIVAFSLVPFHS